MKNKKLSSIYWGIIFIVLGFFIILKCFGVDFGSIGALPTVDVALGVIILAIMIVSLVKLHFPIVPFELAALFLIFESEIANAVGAASSNLINNWLVLLCALMLCIGISLIQGAFGKKNPHFNFKPASKTFNTSDGKASDVKMSSETKYIDCTTFDNYTFCVKMGDGDVFFENAEAYKGGGVLNIECKMGDLTVHVPRSWQIKVNAETALGDTDIEGEGTVGGPNLTINSVCRMGNIDIVYC